MLIGPALRLDILDDVCVIAKSAVDRLSKKLARHKVGSGSPPCRLGRWQQKGCQSSASMP